MDYGRPRVRGGERRGALASLSGTGRPRANAMVACSPAIALISTPLILNCMEHRIEATADEDLLAQIREGKREDAKVRDFEELALELGI